MKRKIRIVLFAIPVAAAATYLFFTTYTPTFFFDGAGTRFGGFKKVPVDLGRECASDDDCEYNCLVTEESLNAAACKPDCFSSTSCPGVRGACGNAGVFGTHLAEVGKVRRFCVR